ncbi:GNAT family N-acetyltransferase [Streptomyces rubellomurinus]|uniref:GNAT family N-acetyltransferase n=1 Tax=Streptomyces rubellomurinus (strain ATCC 31215) TaxID=359131 RepID=UPI00099BC044|nr:GNAT family protein [Streptomyces rubellomurinus]
MIPAPIPLAAPAHPLTDGVVTLRPQCAADAEAVAAGRDPERHRWREGMPAAYLREWEARQAGRRVPLVVADAATDEPVGLVELARKLHACTLLTCRIFPERRRQGLATRAVRLLSDWGRGDADLPCLQLEAAEADTAWLGVAEKNGFERLHTRRGLVRSRPQVLLVLGWNAERHR